MATRLHPAERREQILDATMRLVARDGFARVTLRDVAAEVGVVHGLIRHYFPTREQLVAEAFDAAVRTELAGDEEVAERVEPFEALADWLTTTPSDHYFVWMDAWSEAQRNPELLASLTHHHRDCEHRLARIIERLTESGLGASDDPAADAKMLTALVDGIAVQHHAIGLIDRAQADRVVYHAAEDRLGIRPGTLTRSRPTAARGQWVAAAAGGTAD
ncbi:TetR/AcrR family transcriptional regulator [Agromyces neolithicus]|uniref:TetR/AcrR family transcriptional regulator n=1 Tax=Agromyces neolithicus TaxID=269420 RepID=A0ABN2LS13_9MICO